MRVARTSLTALAGLAAAAVLALVLAGCGGVSNAAEPGPTPSPGGTYVLPIEWDPSGFDPPASSTPRAPR